MANRRVKNSINNKYVQPLKLSFKNKKVITLAANYNCIMTKVSHKAQNDCDFKIQSWMKFNTDSFDGVQLVAGFFKGKVKKTIGSCNFKVYAISTDDSWTETLIASVSGIALVDGRFKAVLTDANLTPAELEGELSFKLEVEILRAGKTFNDVYFFNHIGIYGSFIRLKQDVEFLDITKLDE